MLEEVKYAVYLIWFCTCVLPMCECAQCEMFNQMTDVMCVFQMHITSSKIILYYLRIKVVKCIVNVSF